MPCWITSVAAGRRKSVAPPLEVSNQYLPVLGKIAQFSKEPDVPERLLRLQAPAEFMKLLEEKGV